MNGSALLRATRLRRRLVLLLAVAVLFAGIAQASHYHKYELAGGNSTDVHCLLCLYAASSAAPSAPTKLLQRTALLLVRGSCPVNLTRPRSLAPASYDARGPPLA